MKKLIALVTVASLGTGLACGCAARPAPAKTTPDTTADEAADAMGKVLLVIFTGGMMKTESEERDWNYTGKEKR